MPPRLVNSRYMVGRGKSIYIEVSIYANSLSVQSRYIIGCTSAEDSALCRQTARIEASHGVCSKSFVEGLFKTCMLLVFAVMLKFKIY